MDLQDNAQPDLFSNSSGRQDKQPCFAATTSSVASMSASCWMVRCKVQGEHRKNY